MSIPSIIPITILGPRYTSLEPFHFLDETKIIYIAGANIVAHCLVSNEQKLLFGAKVGSSFTALAVSREKHYFAVAETAGNLIHSISVYTIPSFRRRRNFVIQAPSQNASAADLKLKPVIALAFTTEPSTLVVATGDILLTYWNWEKTRCLGSLSLSVPFPIFVSLHLLSPRDNASTQSIANFSMQLSNSQLLQNAKNASKTNFTSSLAQNSGVMGFLSPQSMLTKLGADGTNPSLGSSKLAPSIYMNMYENTLFALHMPGFLRFMRITNGEMILKAAEFQTPVEESLITAFSWVSNTYFVVATLDSVFIVEKSTVRSKVAGDLEDLKETDLSLASSTEQKQQLMNTSQVIQAKLNSVTSVVVTTRLIIVANAEKIRFYSRGSSGDSNDGMRFLSASKLSESIPRLMLCSPLEEKLLVITNTNSGYIFNLGDLDSESKETPKATLVLPQTYFGPITDMDICIRKSIVAILSADKTVRIYNFLKGVCELAKEFPEEPGCISLHPSGYYILLGFSDRLRFMKILSDDIVTEREFPLRGCRKCCFANGGHMFAASQGSVVHVYNVWTYELVTPLKGHNGKITTISWAKHDVHLITAGSDGAVYSWNINEAKRENEYILKGVTFNSAYEDSEKIYAIGSDKILRIISDSTVIRELSSSAEHTQIVLSYSGRMLFSSASSGAIVAYKFPFAPTGSSLDAQDIAHGHQMHCGRIPRMRISNDGVYLFSVGEDGCLIVYRITRKDLITKKSDEGQAAAAASLAEAPRSPGDAKQSEKSSSSNNSGGEGVKSATAKATGQSSPEDHPSTSAAGKAGSPDGIENESGSACMFDLLGSKSGLYDGSSDGSDANVYTDAVLVTKSDLMEKNNTIQEFQSRKDELVMEHDYQVRLKDVYTQTKLKDLTGEMTKVLEGLKVNMMVLKGEKEKDETKQKEALKVFCDEHKKLLIEIEAKNSAQLIAEYEKYQIFQDQLRAKQTKWDTQLRSQEATDKHEIAEKSRENKHKIQRKETDIVKLVDEFELKQKGNREYSQQKNEELETEISQIIKNYDTLMFNEQQVGLRLKGENGVMKKKFMALNKEIEENKQEIGRLRQNSNRLQKVLSVLEHEVELLKTEILERDKAIQKQEKRVHELKKENQEREKYKFVLDYKIKDLKKQIEPKEQKIAQLKENIYKINEQLSENRAFEEKATQEIIVLEAQLATSSAESSRLHAKVHMQKQAIRQCQTDVTYAMDYFQESDLLKRVVMNMHDKYCQGMQPEKPAEQSSTHMELMKQERQLKKTIKGLKAQCHEQNVSLRAEHFSWVQENRRLLQEIENLKKEKSSLSTLSTAYNKKTQKSNLAV